MSTITANRNEIRDAIAGTFRGSIHFLDGKSARGNITPCDMDGHGNRTGVFTEVTVSPVTGYQTPRRYRLQDIVAIEIKGQ
jgi:hypothetical protein